MFERRIALCMLLMAGVLNSAEAAVSDYYFGDYYTYRKTESYESALGGQVFLLQPAGYDYYSASWLPDALLLEGPITAESAGVVSRLLKAKPSIRSIYLDSPGGDLLSGMQIGSLIFQAQLRTAVNYGSQCQSACALAFIAGRQRLMLAEDAKFGFHRQYYVIDGKVSYGPWTKDVKQINDYLRSVESKGITAEEIVGTTGQASMSQSRLKEKGIATVTRDERMALTIGTTDPKTPYERFRYACHALQMTDVCKATEPLLREPAVRMRALFNWDQTPEENRKRLLAGFRVFNQEYANATPETLFGIDCKYTKPSFSEYLDLGIAEISLSVSSDTLKAFESRRDRLVRRCSELLGKPR
jgi:ATP-dependent protease ClpP protease subunit